MAVTLGDQLATLQRERESLEQILMLDANWRALRQLDDREAAGEPLEAIDGAQLRERLDAVLSTNRLYAARAKIIEAIELLDGTRPPPALAAGAPQPSGRPPTISSRIVLLTETEGLPIKGGSKPAPVESIEQVHPEIPVPSPVLATVQEPEPEQSAETDQAVPSLAEIASRIGSFAAAVQAPIPAVPDRLDLISGLDATAVDKLHAGHITSFAAIAAWTSAETREWRVRLGVAKRGTTSGWIEQAAILATGRETAHSARVKQHERDSAEVAARAVIYEILPPPPAAVIVETPPQVEAEVPAVRWKRAFDRRARGEFARTVVAVAPNPVMAVAATTVPVSVERPPTEELSAGTTGFEEAEHEADIEIRTVVVAAEPEAQAELVEADQPAGSGSLMRRLHQAGPHPKFNRHSYAAYYDAVEEASVSIVRPGEPVKLPDPALRPTATPPAPTKVNRFLKALTGKG